MASWITPRRAIWLAVIVFAVVFGVVVVAGSSERACANCHESLTSARTKTAHASTGCYACHAPQVTDKIAFKANELFVMYPAALIGRGLTGPASETRREGCLDCHATVLEGTGSGASGIKINHQECAPDASCDSCHSVTAHGAEVRWVRQPVMEDCTSCHRREGASIECDACHAGKLKTERLEAGPWQVTHGPQWETVHGMGDLESCGTCHAEDYCARCHKVAVPHSASFGGEHGEAAIADSKSCFQCHKTRQYCDSCHGVAMPHPTGFLKEHSKVAVNVDDPACERCHAPEDCERCHQKHVHPGYAREAAGLEPPPIPGSGDKR